MDIIEKEGINRAKEAARQANVIVCILDASTLDKGITHIQDLLKDSPLYSTRKILYVANKVDLIHDSATTLPDNFSLISCKTNTGIDTFLNKLTKEVIAQVSSPDREGQAEEGAIITRARHRTHVENAIAALKRFENRSREGLTSMDMAAEELRLATSELGRITGAVDVEDMLDVLFADFCIGK